MKKLILMMILFCGSNVFAASGTDLMKAVDAAVDEARVEININLVDAFKATPESGDEVLVSFKAKSKVHEYGCHYHGSDMACHEEEHLDQSKRNKHEEGFDHILEGYRAALTKLSKTLSHFGSDLNVLKSLKVWKRAKSNDGHGHGADVWTKVKYDLNDEEMTVFIQCHEHKADRDMACHYKRKGKGEPSL